MHFLAVVSSSVFTVRYVHMRVPVESRFRCLLLGENLAIKTAAFQLRRCVNRIKWAKRCERAACTLDNARFTRFIMTSLTGQNSAVSGVNFRKFCIEVLSKVSTILCRPGAQSVLWGVIPQEASYKDEGMPCLSIGKSILILQ